MFIYKITNKITSKHYVGQTKRTLEKRMKSHIYEASVNKYGMLLHNSIRKHGSENFSIELIEECSADEVFTKERCWIRELNTLQPHGYNEHEGGKGGCLNPSPELRKKLSDAKKGTVPWNKGLNKSDPRVAAYAQEASKSLKDKPKSEQHKQAIRNAKLARSVSLTEDASQTSE